VTGICRDECRAENSWGDCQVKVSVYEYTSSSTTSNAEILMRTPVNRGKEMAALGMSPHSMSLLKLLTTQSPCGLGVTV
jgi:hypothetical protein